MRMVWMIACEGRHVEFPKARYGKVQARERAVAVSMMPEFRDRYVELHGHRGESVNGAVAWKMYGGYMNGSRILEEY